MAIYHLSGTVISRSQGRSAVACAAYRSGERLHDERYDKTHDYTRKDDVAYTEILLPENAPPWMGEREFLWNAVELCEKRKDAQLAREIQISLPRELSLSQNIELAREFVQKEFVARGMVADVCIHNDKTPHGEAQPHAHILLTFREVNVDGFGQKVREWNAKENLLLWRETWAETANRHLALHGYDLRIDHRSYQAQGIELVPQSKIGTAVAYDRMARMAEHKQIARENGEKIYVNPRIALDALTRQQSTFTHQDLARFIDRHTVDADQFQRVYEKTKADCEIVHLGLDEKGRDRYTTQAMLDVEMQMMGYAQGLAQRANQPIVSEATQVDILASQEKPLTEQQQWAYRYLLGEGDIQCVVGYAGTGKSHLLNATRQAWEQAGYKVQGVTLSGIAAENLEKSSGIESRTLASRFYYWDKGEQPLNSKTVLVVDEAGMLGSRQLERLLREAYHHHAKVVLIGDPWQLQAIEAGGAFRAVSDRISYVELTDVYRQREGWQKEATQAFAQRRTEEGLAAYVEHGCVHVFETQATAKQALVERWFSDHQQRPEKTQIMLSYTCADVKDLNEHARALRMGAGELGESSPLHTTRGLRDFAAHDRVYFLENHRELEVKNGTLGTVEKIEGQQLTVRLDSPDTNAEPSRTITFNTQHYANIDYGYAATIHKGQGVTVDKTYVLASRYMDSHATYVSHTRHREQVITHWSREEFKEQRDLVQTLSRDRAKDVTLDYQHALKDVAACQPTIEQDAIQSKPVERDPSYRQAQAAFKQEKERAESALARVYARREAKALQQELTRLTRHYDKSISHDIQPGEKGIYRESFTVGEKRYAVLEQGEQLKVISCDKELSKVYKDREVTLKLKPDSNTQKQHVTLEPTKARSINKDRSQDFDIGF